MLDMLHVPRKPPIWTPYFRWAGRNSYTVANSAVAGPPLIADIPLYIDKDEVYYRFKMSGSSQGDGTGQGFIQIFLETTQLVQLNAAIATTFSQLEAEAIIVLRRTVAGMTPANANTGYVQLVNLDSAAPANTIIALTFDSRQTPAPRIRFKVSTATVGAVLVSIESIVVDKLTDQIWE